MPNSTDQRDDVFFETLAWSAAISKATTRKIIFNMFSQNGKTCGQPFNNDGESPSVRFASCQVPKHA